MDLLRFGDQHCFFNDSLGLFGLRPFFSMRGFGFLASGLLQDNAVPFFRMDL